MADRLSQYCRDDYKKVGGFLGPASIKCICALSEAQKDIGIKGNVCEIGIHHGRLFILLHLLTEPDEHSIACDLFERQDENISYSGSGDKSKFLENLQSLGADFDRISIFTENSANLRPEDLLTHGDIRLFSVDGGHDPDTAYNDIALATETIVEGGIIFLDDFMHYYWPGVSEALYRYMNEKERDLWPVAIIDGKLILTNTEPAAIQYKIQIIESFYIRCDMHSSIMAGKSVLIVKNKTLRKWLKKYLQERSFWKRMKKYRLVDEFGKVIEKFF